MSNTRITTIQRQRVTARFLNAAGANVNVDGVPQWSSSDPGIVTVEPAADGRSAYIVAGAPGLAIVTLTADARIGDGVVEISNTFDVEVVNDEAVLIEFDFAEPEPK